ncbi:MAG: hypothetical protein PSU94_05230 [Lacunisphaera sp.]|nr:hypothetical protein [Lacunisphaera sp.]
MTLTWLALSLAGGYLTALLFYPALAFERRKRGVVLIGLGLLLLLFPLLLPAGERMLRFSVGAIALLQLAKLYDLHVGVEQGFRPKGREFLLFIFRIFAMVERKQASIPRPTRRQDLLLLAVRIGQAAALVALYHWLTVFNWTGIPWLVEHGALTMGFGLFGVVSLGLPAVLIRLRGGTGFDFVNAADLLAKTPAEFWRRWNQPTQQFLYEDVFKRNGGLRSPVRAIAATFVLSAVAHEYVFGIALGRVEGYQTVFFLLQGLAVAATMRIRPTGWKVWPWTAATLGFNLVSSVFFMVSINGLSPFYSHGVPAWLRGG